MFLYEEALPHEALNGPLNGANTPVEGGPLSRGP